MSENKYGKVYDEGTLFMCIEVGTVKSSSTGNEYEMFNNLNQSMLLKSRQTGKYFSFSWQDLVEMAQEAGIDEQNS